MARRDFRSGRLFFAAVCVIIIIIKVKMMNHYCMSCVKSGRYNFIHIFWPAATHACMCAVFFFCLLRFFSFFDRSTDATRSWHEKNKRNYRLVVCWTLCCACAMYDVRVVLTVSEELKMSDGGSYTGSIYDGFSI